MAYTPPFPSRPLIRTNRTQPWQDQDALAISAFGRALLASRKVTGVLGEMMRALSVTVH